MGTAALALMAPLSSTEAQSGADADVSELRRQIEILKEEQASAGARIQALEATLDRIEGSPAREARTTAPGAPAPTQTALASPVPFNPAGGSAPGVAPSPAPNRFTVTGDFRLRYESNFGDDDARNRGRGVLRARLRPAYALNDWLTLGGQIATGDPDDPNSTDITLSSFDDDLQVSLDQAYARLTFGNVILYGGKIPQPFVRTELVWDGDVSPQGISAAYKTPVAGGSLKATGLYFLVDESVAGPDSDMIGVQLGFDTAADAPWRVELAAGYYDYSLRSVAGADSGDLRSNLLRTDGRYLSDFDLFDAIAAVTYQGFGERWPIRLVGDYVKNLGAATDADTGLSADLLVGRASAPGDWRIGYGYAVAETDAVLAAFSHDNTNIATNYRQHTLTFDYVPRPHLLLNATFYHYRPYRAVDAGSNDPGDWLDRLRLNLLVSF
jgi:hypothetical protein